MADRQLEILQHALGLNQYGQGSQYRNHFVTGPGSKDYDDCCALVEAGMMQNKGASPLSGGNDCFVVTRAGISHVAENSPPAPKLSRSQSRYRAWLRADCGLSFAEWLGIDGKRGLHHAKP